MRARDIMTSPVISVTPATTVKKAAALLAKHGFTALPVVDAHERLAGIVTEADIVRGRIPRDPRALIHPGPPEADRHVAKVLAEAVPGVVRALATTARQEDDR